MEVTVNSQDVSFDVVAVSSTSHLTGLTAADFTIWYHRPGEPKIFIPLSDKSEIDDPHFDGAIIEVGNGAYQLDSPDALFVNGVANVAVGGTCLGGSLVVTNIDINSSTLGSGSDQCTMNIKAAGSPVADADVWITIDALGENVFAGVRQTDSQGNVLFLMDHGVTYYLWMQKDGIESIDGEEFIAQRD